MRHTRAAVSALFLQRFPARLPPTCDRFPNNGISREEVSSRSPAAPASQHRADVNFSNVASTYACRGIVRDRFMWRHRKSNLDPDDRSSLKMTELKKKFFLTLSCTLQPDDMRGHTASFHVCMLLSLTIPFSISSTSASR